jgi:hypothetical protein
LQDQAAPARLTRALYQVPAGQAAVAAPIQAQLQLLAAELDAQRVKLPAAPLVARAHDAAAGADGVGEQQQRGGGDAAAGIVRRQLSAVVGV